MMKKFLLTILVITFFLPIAHAQDTLPNFSVRDAGNNRNVISWVNNYQKVKQISIQRSAESTKNFRTILSVPDPMNKQNGFVDTKAPSANMYYRLFIMLEGAMYIFSPSKRAFVDTSVASDPGKKLLDPFGIEINKPLKDIDSLITFNDKNSKNKPNIFVPSMYVYTARDGNVHLNLPEVESKKYHVKFYDEVMPVGEL